MEEEPPASSHLTPAADGVLRRALAKDPAARFESCTAFAAALRDACIPKPAANIETVRRKVPVILTAGVVVACLLLGASAAWRLRSRRALMVASQARMVASQARMVASQARMVASQVDTQPRVTPPEQAPASAAKSTAIKPQPTANQKDASTPPCQSARFVLAQYGDALSGEMIWNGSLPARGRLNIDGRRADTGRVRGDVLPHGAPVHLSVSPETIRLAVSPVPANCWMPGLVLQNTGTPATEIRIRWEVFQP
jgi:hypothetical protein